MVSPPDGDFNELSPGKQPPPLEKESQTASCFLTAIVNQKERETDSELHFLSSVLLRCSRMGVLMVPRVLLAVALLLIFALTLFVGLWFGLTADDATPPAGQWIIFMI